MNEIRLLLADDDPILLNGLHTLLDRQDGLFVVAAVANGAAALEALTKHTIDVALLDVNMPVIDGISTAKQIRDRHPNITVVMLTAFEYENSLAQALAAGAKGFLTKDIPAPQLAELIRQAHAGDTVMGQKPTQLLAAAYLGAEERREQYADFIAAVSELPAHLRAVFSLVVEAVPNRMIANQLHLSEATVRVYVSTILATTQCRTRSELAVIALKAGVS